MSLFFYASTAGIVGAAKPLLLGEVPELVEGPTPVVMEPKGGSRNEVSIDPGKPLAKKTAAKKFSKYSLCCIKTKILL